VRVAVKDPSPDVRSAALRALSNWSNAEAAPDLLALARATTNPTEKMLCLRGYLRLAGESDLSPEKRVAMCRQAAEVADTPAEKKLLLAALGNTGSVDALALIAPHLDDENTRDEASAACLRLAETLLKGRDLSSVSAQVTGSLEKVAQVTANAELAKRARSLIDRERKKLAEK
jgi:HEAT repeat protein